MNSDLKEKLERVKLVDFYACIQLLIALIPALMLKMVRPNIWLVCEDKNEARDNGYWLFKYICEEHPEVDVVYAINKKSPDYNKVKNLGNVISYGTLVHWIYYLAADKNISSQKGGKPNAAVCYVLEVYCSFKINTIFLQHGVIHNDLPWLYFKNTKMNLFLCGAKKEFDFIKSRFGYPESSVKYVGLTRFDNLHNNKVKANQILVMPTWREWIGTPTSKSYDLDDMTSFKTTEYFKKWHEFLNNKELSKILDDFDLQLVFYPHRNMQKFLDEFNVDSERIVVADWKKYDVQQLLKESAFLITDYSSIFMDFAYMRKPMAYYQFDYEKFRLGQYQEGYFSYKDDGFGPVFEEAESLVNYIRQIAKNRFVNPEKYYLKEINFFPLYDQNNCERTYQAILDM